MELFRINDKKGAGGLGMAGEDVEGFDELLDGRATGTRE